MKTLLLSLACLFSVVSYGQTTILEKDSVPSKKSLITDNKQIPVETQRGNPAQEVGATVFPAVSLPDNPQLPSVSNFSGHDYSLPSSDSVDASQLKYEHFKTLLTLSETIALSGKRSSHNFMYEGNTSVGLSLLWRPNEKLTISVTPSISRYFFGPQQLMSVVLLSVNATVRYQVSDWLAFKTFGEYTVNGNKMPDYSFLTPQNVFGASVMVKVTRNIGIEAGVEAINSNGRWNRGIYPNPIEY
jgi:hypothetical protein